MPSVFRIQKETYSSWTLAYAVLMTNTSDITRNSPETADRASDTKARATTAFLRVDRPVFIHASKSPINQMRRAVHKALPLHL